MIKHKTMNFDSVKIFLVSFVCFLLNKFYESNFLMIINYYGRRGFPNFILQKKKTLALV